jgi:hypothetical protein
VGGTGQPKAGQDPQDPANRAGNGLRPAKVPPEIGRGVPARTASGGRGIPAEIANGSSGDEASFASKDKLASKDKDNEHDPDEDITAVAQFDLGVPPSDGEGAAATGLLGAAIGRRVLAALREDTNDEASSAAAAQVTLCNAIKPDDKAEVEANWQSRRDGPTRKEAGRATKRMSHHPGGPSPQVLMADEDANITANWQTKERGHPREEASWATKQKANHAAHQGGGTRSPQVFTVLFGSTTGTNEGRTGQRKSAADFFLAPRKAGDSEAWVQAEKAHKEAAHAAAQRRTNHSANQGGGMRSPQATALFGSTVGNFQGETGQRGSAADFFPAPRKGRRAEGFLPATGTPYKKEATAQGTHVPSHRV